MDLMIIYGRLVPGFKGKGCFYDNSFVWMDERPQPTQEECEAEWAVYSAEVEQKNKCEEARKTYEDALNSGYLHTDGVTYNCSESATLDYVKIITLMDIELDEPIYLLDFNDNPVAMSYADFKNMAVAVGKHQYSLRKNYWTAIMS